MASASTNSEAKELNLVNNVEMKFALADTDTKLERILGIYLTPLLLKLESQHASVRNKVISVCKHVNTRVDTPSLKLPVAALLEQYKGHTNHLVRHFDLLYVSRGFERVLVKDRLALLPILIQGISINFRESKKQSCNIFYLFLRLLHHFTFPERGTSEDTELRIQLGLNENVEDAKCISILIGNLIVLTPRIASTNRGPDPNEEEWEFLHFLEETERWDTSKNGLNLSETKVRALKFISSGAFIDSERFQPALLASAVPNTRLSEIAEDILKRTLPAISLEDKALVERLFGIYLPNLHDPSSVPATPALRIKILNLLCKSPAVSAFTSLGIDIICQGAQPGSPGAPKPGLETSKLQSQIFTFTNWLLRISPKSDLIKEAPKLNIAMTTCINAQGWPVPAVNDKGEFPTFQLRARNLAYETLGLLLAATAGESSGLPQIFSLAPGSVGWLRESLSGDPSSPDTSASIEQALSSVLGSLRSAVDEKSGEGLVKLLTHHMGRQVGESIELGPVSGVGKVEVVRNTRSFAVRYANRCLPFRNVNARRIDISAIDSKLSESQEISDEGRRGLDPFWHRNVTGEAGIDDKAIIFPDFSELTKIFFESETEVAHVGTLENAVNFLQSVLIRQALAHEQQTLPAIDSSWDRNLEISIKTNEAKRAAFAAYLRGTHKDASLNKALLIYLEACFHGFRGLTQKVSGRCGEILLNILSLLPREVAEQLAKHAPSLLHIDYATDLSLMATGAEIFGILGFYHSEVITFDEITELHTFIDKWQVFRTEKGGRFGSALLALSFFESRQALHPETEGSKRLQKRLLDITIDMLIKSKDNTMKNIAAMALGELGLFGVLPRTTALCGKLSDDAMTVLQKETLETLFDMSRGSSESAISTLGFLASRCDKSDMDGIEDSALSKVLDLLYDLYEVRQPEIHFAVGAAMSCAAIGWQSKSLVAKLDIDATPPQLSDERTSYLTEVMDKVLDACSNTKPALRQASVIWLLCLVQYCGHHGYVQARLRRCQEAFKSFLADRDSLNQESAARGLSLCFEKGDRELKDDLVRDLVTSFTGTKKSEFGKVSGDTELFEPGALPIGDNKSVTTYKDILSLASEVGDPSLVYRFMSLATNNSIWSSRAAFGRFGLSTILSDSSVDGYLANNPKLYSALFRYRFDPNQNVRNSMNDIWNALVKDSAATIVANFDIMLQDLLRNILGKEWRTRQASCAAIANLLQGQTFGKYEKYLSEIWLSALKISDDIKESVQIAGLELCKTLTGILTRNLLASSTSGPDSSKQESSLETPASRQLKVVFSFIFSPAGIESRSEIVQSFSLWALLEIIKASKPATLRLFVPDIVGHLLGLLSASEPMVANYLRQRADQHGTTAQDVDDVRLKLIRDSPLTEAIERSLDTIDPDSMEAIAESLEEAMKTVVGLPSKVGTSRVLVSLSTRHNFAFRPFANRFLRLATKQLLDINDTVSAAFATACGYIARLASDQEILRIVQYCRKLYFEADDERHRAISGETLLAISKHATDRFNSLSASMLPLIFIAKHDLDERTKSSFKTTWDENVGGSRSVLLYFRDIMSLISPQLASPKWSVKHSSSLAAANAITTAGHTLSDADAKSAWPVLEEALRSKTWSGKEEVLRSFIVFVQNRKALTDETLASQVRKIMIREAKRNDVEYRVHALSCLAEFCKLDEKEDHFPQVLQIVEPLMINDKDAESESMDVDSKTGGPSSKSVSELIPINSARVLLAAINPCGKVRTGAGLISALEQSQKLLAEVMTSKASQKTQTLILEEIGVLLKRLLSESAPNGEIQQTLVPYIDLIFMPGVERVEQTRSKAAEVAERLAYSIGSSGSNELLKALESALRKARQEERSNAVQKTLEQALLKLE